MTRLPVPRLLTVAQVARLTGVQRWRIYELISRGQGPPVLRLGRTIRVSEAALLRWIEEQERQHAPGAAPE
jgi:excisionase family DNA binding protein